jgi:tetratricopeptide (TPR) repeat protein
MYKIAATAMAAILLMLLNGQAVAGLDEVARMIEGGRYQAALESLSSSARSHRSRLLQANALAGLKRRNEAEAIYLALIDEAPQDPTPYNNLAALYAASGRLQEASELLTRAMQSDARYAAVYKNLSHVYVEMSRNAYAKALRMGEPQQGLKLLTLDHRDGPAAPLQVAAVTAAVAAPVPAPAPHAAALVQDKPPAVSPLPAVAAVQAVPAEPAAEPRSGADFDAGGAIAALKQWAAAWSAQDVEGYLAAYDRDFLPPHDLTPAQWQAQRRVRLKKPNKIEVMLSDFQVSSTGRGSLTVKLLQRYRSDSYRDTTRKGFIMVLRDGGWKIGDEYTIEVIN